MENASREIRSRYMRGSLAVLDMRHLALAIFIYSCLPSWGQNAKKLLTKNQLDSVNRGQTIYFKVDGSNCKYFENFQGLTKVRKIKGKIYFDFVIESSSFDKDGKLSQRFTYDEFGNVVTYQAFDSSGQITIDCSFETMDTKGYNYRLEHCKFYYTPNVLWYEAYRYLKQTDIGGHLNYSRNKKYGVWNYYDNNGQLTRTKDFGDIQ